MSARDRLLLRELIAALPGKENSIAAAGIAMRAQRTAAFAET